MIPLLELAVGELGDGRGRAGRLAAVEADRDWALTERVGGARRVGAGALGVAGRFAAICGQDTFAWSKPDARALLSTIDRAGGAPNASIMVGDSRTDIATAKRPGGQRLSNRLSTNRSGARFKRQ